MDWFGRVKIRRHVVNSLRMIFGVIFLACTNTVIVVSLLVFIVYSADIPACIWISAGMYTSFGGRSRGGQGLIACVLMSSSFLAEWLTSCQIVVIETLNLVIIDLASCYTTPYLCYNQYELPHYACSVLQIIISSAWS